jgi:hypothetical protein
MIIVFDFDKLSVHLRRQMKRKRALLESNPDRDTFDE